MNENMLFADDFVEVAWSLRSKHVYESLGYTFTKFGDKITIPTEHLSLGSNIRVRIICPDCREVRSAIFGSVSLRQTTVCDRCSRARRAKNLIGKRYGRWLVVKHCGKYVDGSHSWLCRCDCGNERIIPTCNLVSGASVSCGCYHIERISGENHYRYNDSLMDEARESTRDTTENIYWRYKIKELAKFICQACGDGRGGNLVAHHLDSWSAFPGKRYDIDNGVCLCEECHKCFHHYYGFGNNTKQQYGEWISNQTALDSPKYVDSRQSK